MPYAAVSFPASDGLRLDGWTVPSDPQRPWVIFCHGLGANRADLLDFAAVLHGARFNLLLFDFRAHGSSAGQATSFGWREQRDLEGALTFLGGQPEVPARPVGVFGVSMGGAVALMVAARDERIAAVAVDSPYQDLDAAIRHYMGLMFPRLPIRPLVPFVLATYRLRFGVWPRQVSAERAARRLGRRPLLVFKATADPQLPPEGAEAIHRAAEGPKELVVMGAQAHLGSYAADPEGYGMRLRRFFERAL